MIKRVIKYINIIGLVISLALILYGIYGPYYNITPLKSSFSFATVEPQIFEFKVNCTEEYMVEIHLKNVIPKEQIDTIIGDFVKSGEGAKVNIEWSLKDGNKIVAKGSNKEYGYSPIWGGGYSGLAIGKIPASKGKSYYLTLQVISVNPDWNATMPYVEVGLHPAQLEYLIGYFIYGILLLVIFGMMACYFLYKSFEKHITNGSI